jgi:mannose-6-phosphate isomerase-like protein (cupin superfamily)
MSSLHRPLDSTNMFARSIDRLESFEFSDDQHAISMTMTTGEVTHLDADSSHYVVVCDGDFIVSSGNRTHHLSDGCFGSFPGAIQLQGSGRALIVSTVGYQSQLLAGGPIEDKGRLRYVDGCTSSLLLSPPVRGEPCLNFMHLPCRISQTLHTHPSLRAGIILSGRGQCETEAGTFDFLPGTVFFIPPNLAHSFQSRDETLRIVIYHPDSDSGPTHTDHTMLNRTFIRGQSAQHLTSLHSRAGVQP